MRALTFMKIDYIKIKQQVWFMPLFWLIALVFGLGKSGDSFIIAFIYLMFTVMIFATSPFGACEKKDAGFLVLLPSTVADRVMGRFLFGLSLTAVNLIILCGIALVRAAFGKGFAEWTLPVCLLYLAATIFLIAVEDGIFYLIGENIGKNFLSLVRIGPGIVIFCLSNSILKNLSENGDADAWIAGLVSGQDSVAEAGGRLLLFGGLSVAAAIILLLASLFLCIKVTGKRDYS